jgi:trehalose 6-phosphate synthase/phosphatase
MVENKRRCQTFLFRLLLVYLYFTGIFVPDEHDTVQYRYCVFCGGKFSRWEGEFRSLDVASDKSLVKATEDFFGVYDLTPMEQTPSKPVVIVRDENSQLAKALGAMNRSKYNCCTLDKNDNVIVVSYFLPVTLSRKNNGIWSAQWDKEALLSSLHLDVSRVIWVGSVRYGSAPIPVEEEDSVTAVLADLNCVPVFINQTMHVKFYEGFCKKSLWLVLHHVADVYGPLQQSDKSAKVDQDLWFNYSTVHKMFREKVLEVYQQGYLIWIHGLHLMLLPNFLRRRLPQAKIGYFFHTPFPSSEIWRTMARREDLLRGLLGADQIGFHLYEYARHFLTTCHRLLGYSNEMNESGMMSVNVDGRQVCITCIHVGVDMPRVKEIFSSPGFKADVISWKERFPGKVIVSGVDRLERLKGIPLRLMAIDRFLENNPRWVGKVLFTLVGISAGERGQDYKQTLHDVRILVDVINEKYASTEPKGVIYFEERSEKDFRLSQRLPYFAASDILLMTATR